MEPQLYMWSGIRRLFLQRHDFYVNQVREKVFVQFQDVSAQAEAYANSEFDRLGSSPSTGDDVDVATIAEWATDRGQEYYGLLSDLRKQMVLGALAGIYHQWEKDLRDFIEKELRHHYESASLRELIWDSNIGKVFETLKEFGWDIKARSWFPDLEACRLIVNVHKHGKGPSLDELAKRYPAYLKNVLDEFGGIWATANRDPDHEWSDISDEQFENLTGALRGFWEEFPERLFLQVK